MWRRALQAKDLFLWGEGQGEEAVVWLPRSAWAGMARQAGPVDLVVRPVKLGGWIAAQGPHGAAIFFFASF